MHPDVYKRPLLLGLVILIAGLLFFYRPSPGPKDPSRFAVEKNSVCVQGIVDGFAVSKKDSRNVVLHVTSADGIKTRGRLYARIQNFEPLWKDEIRLCGKIKTPYGVDLPGNFDWRSYLAHKHIFAEINADGGEVVRPAALFYRAVRFVRADILRTFAENFTADEAGIAGGVLLGEKGDIDPSLYTAFQDSGAIHLLVASGGNVGFVTLMVFGVCSLIGFGRKRTAWLALCAAGIYTLIAGADAPLTRAYFMTICACLGYMLGRNSGVFQGLVLSCVVILGLNPAAVFETGFQMSFLATLAIIVCLNNYTLPYKWPGWIKFFMQIFLATLSTQLILLPLFTNVFYKVSVTGLLANMLLVPMASWLMGITFLFYLCTLVKLGFLLKAVTAASLGIFQYVVQFFAGFKLSALEVAAWGAGTVGAYYCVLFVLFHLPLKKFTRRIAPYLLGLAACLLIGQYVYARAMRVWVFNEWNHSGVLLRTCDGQTLLLGTGINGEKLARAVWAAGAREVSAVLVTETGTRAEKGVQALTEALPVKKIVLPFKQNAWPGEQIVIGQTTVTMEWPFYAAQDGHPWQKRGYGGKKDAVSYRVQACGKEIIIGAEQRFVQTPDGVLRPPHNGSIFKRI